MFNGMQVFKSIILNILLKLHQSANIRSVEDQAQD